VYTFFVKQEHDCLIFGLMAMINEPLELDKRSLVCRHII